jgi:hypothetical protein
MEVKIGYVVHYYKDVNGNRKRFARRFISKEIAEFYVYSKQKDGLTANIEECAVVYDLLAGRMYKVDAETYTTISSEKTLYESQEFWEYTRNKEKRMNDDEDIEEYEDEDYNPKKKSKTTSEDKLESLSKASTKKLITRAANKEVATKVIMKRTRTSVKQ